MLNEKALADMKDKAMTYFNNDYKCQLHELGVSLLNGDGGGILQNYKEAFDCFKYGVERRDSVSQYNLGRMYENGWSVGKDNAKAETLYALAAEQGHPEAQYNLSQISHEKRSDFSAIPISGDSNRRKDNEKYHARSVDIVAHMWANLAASSGIKEAVTLRDKISENMDVRAITDAQDNAKAKAEEINKKAKPSNVQD